MSVPTQFAECAEQWFQEAKTSEVTKKQRRCHYARDIEPVFGNRLLSDITEGDVKALCEQVKARGAPATAVLVLGIFRQIYIFARFKGYPGGSPVRFMSNASITRFSRRIRVMRPEDIALLDRLMSDLQVKDHYQLAIRLMLLTLARRGEVLLARWEEIDFESAVWTVPPGRVKSTKARSIHLSTQALDVLIQLKTLAGRSEYVFPSPRDAFVPMAPACLDVNLKAICRRARALELSLQDFAPSDFRTTGEEHLKQAGFDMEWIEVAMAREVDMYRHGIRDTSLYARPLRHMLQEWANMLDAWVAGEPYTPELVPASLVAA
jgi:integrase